MEPLVKILKKLFTNSLIRLESILCKKNFHFTTSTPTLSYDHPMILAGQGTMGIEIVEQVPEVDAVVIPVGGGGLAAGVALSVKTLKPKVKIYVGCLERTSILLTF